MKKVLVINASARILHSQSRTLTELFMDQWKTVHRDPIVRVRELGNTVVPHITDAWIAANLKPVASRTAEELDALRISDTYIRELRDADIVVLGTPMYNWSIPSALKAYIDQVLRLNETFRIDPGNARQPYVGLLENKTLVLLVARGIQGYEIGQENEHLNFQTTYLKTVFNMVGIHDIHLVAIDGTSLDKERLKQSVEIAHRDILDLIEHELN
jgi:FMN-dependent NADH-azoreductase